MQYVLLIHEEESFYEGAEGAQQMEETVAKHQAMIGRLVAEGVEFSGNRLQPGSTATTIRWDDGEHALHDGPFAETHEELGGYYVIDVADLDAALEWAKQIPIPGKGAVEVRPVFVEG
ncbi:YciI family protein [Aurantiacibacter sp. MUD61]|uniref:YciI family protein n=1 Tax=Aurantiacibacter sp. MUD61 TaxID=3009083 RepID=UPI0022F067F8|nr:YciI family protein [Aurantiacibacter sp. MUD61]